MKRFLQRFIDPLAKEEENVGIDITEPVYMQRLAEVIQCSTYACRLVVSKW